MSDDNKVKSSENKPKVKTYTEQELNEELVKRIEEAKIKSLSFSVQSNMDNFIGKLEYPKFTVTISGGDPEKLKNLQEKILKLLVKLQSE